MPVKFLLPRSVFFSNLYRSDNKVVVKMSAEGSLEEGLLYFFRSPLPSFYRMQAALARRLPKEERQRKASGQRADYLPQITGKVDTTVRTKAYAFFFQQTALFRPPGSTSPLAVHHAMGRQMLEVIGQASHGPACPARLGRLSGQSGQPPVGYHAPFGHFLQYSIDRGVKIRGIHRLIGRLLSGFSAGPVEKGASRLSRRPPRQNRWPAASRYRYYGGSPSRKSSLPR